MFGEELKDEEKLKDIMAGIEQDGIVFPNETEMEKFKILMAKRPRVTGSPVPMAVVRMNKDDDSLGICPKSPVSSFGMEVRDILADSSDFTRDSRAEIRAASGVRARARESKLPVAGIVPSRSKR